MASGSSSALSAEADEFDEKGFDWNAAVETLAKTEEKVKAAAEREEERQKLIKEAETELKEISRLRKGGSGRPGTCGRAGTDSHKSWSDKLAHLGRGLLPGESDGAAARSPE